VYERARGKAAAKRSSVEQQLWAGEKREDLGLICLLERIRGIAKRKRGGGE